MKTLSDLEKIKLYGQDFEHSLKSVLVDMNKKYGDILFNELINRIETTISLFQDEMCSLQTEFDKLNKDIPRITELVHTQHRLHSGSLSGDDIPEWEYKLSNK